MIRSWARLSLLYLFMVGLLGCLLRLLFFAPVEGLNFKYFLHAHSHVAFLGWVFNALYAGLIFAYIPEKAKSYKILFWLLQIAVLGMMFSFPVQGYAAASITFSTFHIFLSYWFAWKFLKDCSQKKLIINQFSLSFIRWGLFFMVLSSIGPFALGAIMTKGLSVTDLYQLAIYFYLHFQYDGWFSFAVFGMFFWLLETYNITFSLDYAKKFFWLMVLASIPAFALSALWTQPPDWVYGIGAMAAALQVIALINLSLLINNIKFQIFALFDKWILRLMQFAFGAFTIKIILQLASAFPAIAEMAYRVRNFTVGYLHIVFLGFVTVFLIAWFGKQNLLNLHHSRAKTGMLLFLVGFILSETIVFLQPLMLIWGFGILEYSNQMLFIISLLMPMGIGILLLPGENNLKLKKEVFRFFNSQAPKEVFSKI